MAIEIVDFPINSMVIFHCYVSSPEGILFLGSSCETKMGGLPSVYPLENFKEN